MIRVLAIVISLAATTAFPQDAGATGAAVSGPSALETWQADPTVVLDAEGVDISEFKWLARPVVVFADSPADPAFREQIEYLTSRIDALVPRDVVVITDTDPDAASDLRRQLRPRGFMLALIGKDGNVVIRKPLPWDVRELTRSIDKMPLRQQEIREGR